jgi:hypothetical protein
MAFVTRDVSKLVGPNSVRPRPNDKATIARASNTEFYYLASVDEMKRGSSTGLSSRPGRFRAAQTSRISRESSCSWALLRGRPYGDMDGRQFPPNLHEEQFRLVKDAERMVLEPGRADSGRYLSAHWASPGVHFSWRPSQAPFGRRTQAVTLVTALRGLICSNKTQAFEAAHDLAQQTE